MRYSKSPQLLLMQTQIVKQINMKTKEGKIKVHKQERKKEILDEFKNIDKNYVNIINIKEVINNLKKEGKKKNFDEEKIKDLDNQTNNFKKNQQKKRKNGL